MNECATSPRNTLGKKTQKLEGHNCYVSAVAIPPNGLMVALASNDSAAEGIDSRRNAMARWALQCH